MIQGGKKFKVGNRPQEDEQFKVLAKGTKQNFGLGRDSAGKDSKLNEKLAKYLMEDARWQRIVGNDLENIPMALCIFLISVYAHGNVTVNNVAFIAFACARIGHTYCYANALQPGRVVFFMLGISCVFTSAINGVIGSYYLQ